MTIGVARDRRREGIGTNLKEAAMAEFAAAGGGVVVYSQVHKRNVAMLGLNDQLGVDRMVDPDYPYYWFSAIRIAPDVP